MKDNSVRIYTENLVYEFPSFPISRRAATEISLRLRRDHGRKARVVKFRTEERELPRTRQWFDEVFSTATPPERLQRILDGFLMELESGIME